MTNVQNLIELVLKRNKRAIARLITWAEGGTPERRDTLAQVYMKTGRAHIVGVTGVPGSGKSTLVRRLAEEFRDKGKTVGIIAVDPSSPYSGGAILGDRIRMLDIASDPGVFVRSMATRGALGGLSNAALDAVDVLDAAGFDLVIIETVGVGQDEIDIVRGSHTTVVVSAPGLGDDIQAIKAGILEIADIHVVGKADREDSAKTVAELKQMLTQSLGAVDEKDWVPPVSPVSAISGDGLGVLVQQILDHSNHLIKSDKIKERTREITEYRILRIAEGMLRGKFASTEHIGVQELVDQAVRREIAPFAAAVAILKSMKEMDW